MRLKRRTLSATVCALIVLALTASMVLAAYYGKGNFKDVFVNRKNCFNSNLLAAVSDEKDAEKSAFQAENGKTVMVCNYDLSTGEYNAFDMTFSLYAWLDKDGSDEGYYYDLKLGTGTKRVDSTGHTEPIFKDVELKGGQASECSITVSFNLDKNLTNYPKLCLYAIPTSPDYMAQKRLGGCLTPTSTVGFTVLGEFDVTTNDLEDYAAFPYEVTMSGRLDNVTGKVRVEWNAAALTLMAQYNELPEQFDIQDGENDKKYILLPLAEEYYARLIFLRVQDPAEGADNPWTKGTVTLEELRSFVETRIDSTAT